ncbi:hypothetical protein RIF29_21240 [Crotalaria pallida]|uniref:Ion transport domain-containing protein n=1 Tax=Crotalaria pallida TaxID=3830 RepID=A0AAN9I9B9_CROPI
MEVASTIPYEALGYLLTGKHKLGLLYFILGLFRFWRIRRVKQYFTRLEKDIRFSYFWVRCARLLSVTLFSVHCAGCLYYMLDDMYPHQGKTWIGAVMPNFRETSLRISYISAMYWSITTMKAFRMIALEGIEGISDDTYSKAVDAFKEKELREAFLTMSDARKPGWLVV